MTDTSIYWSTFCRHLEPESDNDPLNGTVNHWSNPSRFIPQDRAKCNLKVSVSGFIDESPYTGPGTHLQSQPNRFEIRIMGVIERFEGLKVEINEWEMLLTQQFNSFAKIFQDLARQALLARVDLLTRGIILNFKNIVNWFINYSVTLYIRIYGRYFQKFQIHKNFLIKIKNFYN